MIAISQKKWGQAERIARIIRYLAKDGSKSYPELGKEFSSFSEPTLWRDMKLLKGMNLVVEKKESRTTDRIISRKVFMFFKDNKDIVGKTKKAMENLKRDFSQVTLDQIASLTGLPPDQELQEAAYTLAPKLGLLIGKEAVPRPPLPLIVGAEEKNRQAIRRKKKDRKGT